MRAIETLPDAHGHFGVYGGMFVPETLMTALHELAAEYKRAKMIRSSKISLPSCSAISPAGPPLFISQSD